MIVQDSVITEFDQPEDTLESDEKLNLGDRLMELLNQLPLGYKTILNLFIIEGYSHKEIAEILDISESTSRSQLTRAKGALKKLLAQQELKSEVYD